MRVLVASALLPAAMFAAACSRPSTAEHEVSKLPALEQPASIQTGANDVVVLCGDRGAVAMAAALTGPSSATVEWRTAGRSGRGLVAEHPGARPHEIDGRDTHVMAGPYDVTWSPADVQLSGSYDAPHTFLSGTSWLSFDASIKARKIAGAKLDAVRLDDACR